MERREERQAHGKGAGKIREEKRERERVEEELCWVSSS
jgi:hypothetical protein